MNSSITSTPLYGANNNELNRPYPFHEQEPDHPILQALASVAIIFTLAAIALPITFGAAMYLPAAILGAAAIATGLFIIALKNMGIEFIDEYKKNHDRPYRPFTFPAPQPAPTPPLVRCNFKPSELVFDSDWDRDLN